MRKYKKEGTDIKNIKKDDINMKLIYYRIIGDVYNKEERNAR